MRWWAWKGRRQNWASVASGSKACVTGGVSWPAWAALLPVFLRASFRGRIEAARHPVGALADAVVPGLGRRSLALLHRDAAGDGADERAEVAADALFGIRPGDEPARELAGRLHDVLRDVV